MLALAAGCLGAGSDAGTDPGTATIDNSAPDETSPSNRSESPSSEEDPTTEVTDGCGHLRENASALIAARQEDPFGDRTPLGPRLDSCGSEGVFLLAAHGLEGSRALQLTWSFPQQTQCRVDQGVASVGGHHRFHVETWDHPDRAPTVSFGTGGGGTAAFAGSIHARDLISNGDGKTAWGGNFEADLAAGEHTYTVAASDWSAWNNSITEDSAFLHILVCDGPFSFLGFQESRILHLFDHHDLDRGAGVEARLFTGASVGEALDVQLDEEGELRAAAKGSEGGGAIQVSTQNGEERDTFGPDDGLQLVRDVPQGPLTISLARGGRLTFIAGVVYADMAPLEAEDVVGS